VVVHAQVAARAPRLALRRDDEQRGGLAAADVAALGLGALQRGHQALGEVAVGALERRRHRLRHRGPGHHVRLAGPVRAAMVAGLGDAVGARVGDHAAACVHHADLAHGGERVGGQHGGERVRRRGALLQAREHVGAVRGLDDRLRGDGADARPRPRAERADGEPVRLDGGAELARRGVAGDDRVGAARPHGCARIPAMDRAARVLARIRDTPPGFVRAYGDVSPGAPRFAGAVLSACEDPSVPWHRIVRADGSLAKGRRQRALLESEGVPFLGERVDMRVARLP
jgi:alkylated DNA nucleotide flippase Atl1